MNDLLTQAMKRVAANEGKWDTDGPKEYQVTREVLETRRLPDVVVGQTYRYATVPRGGVGTELKNLLSKFGIKPTSGCKCDQRAIQMDYNGIEWCESHVDEIVGWLEEEAKRRGWPFVRTVATMIVRMAIRRAKRKASSHG